MHVVEKHVDKRKNIWFDYIIICQQIKYDWCSIIAENRKTKKIGGENPQWLYLLYILYQYNIYNIISSTLDAQLQNIFYKYSREQTFFFFQKIKRWKIIHKKSEIHLSIHSGKEQTTRPYARLKNSVSLVLALDFSSFCDLFAGRAIRQVQLYRTICSV